MSNKTSGLKEERDRFIAFAFASADMLIETKGDGTIIFVGGATQGAFGRRPDDLENTLLSELIIDDKEEQHKISELFKSLKSIQRVPRVELQMKGRDDESFLAELSAFKLKQEDDTLYISLCVVNEGGGIGGEIFRRDMYSGLLKKDSFIEETNKKLAEAKATGESVQMTLLDLPELKSLLDSLPTSASIELMSEISEYLRSKSLAGDTAATIDESTYSFAHDGSVSEAEVTKTIIQMTRKADPKGEGVAASAKTIDVDAGKLSSYDTANALLYTINQFSEKKEGFDLDSLSDSYQEMLEETVDKIANFKTTIEGSDFEIAYQPIVDLRTGIIHHYEALIRIDDNKGFKNPFDFVTFGEQTGIIGELDLSMARRTLENLYDLNERRHKPLVAINLSGNSLSSNFFMDSFLRLLDKHPRVRRQMIIEVTESAKISDMDAANAFIQELRNEGNKCCLDDFGVGEASLDYLRRIHVDYVKIDGSYVRESVKTLRGRDMLRAMSALCKDMRMQTIGEYVEDTQIASMLWESGVGYGQGYLFGKPSTDMSVLENCAKPCEGYSGIKRAKRISANQKKSWKKN